MAIQRCKTFRTACKGEEGLKEDVGSRLTRGMSSRRLWRISMDGYPTADAVWCPVKAFDILYVGKDDDIVVSCCQFNVKSQVEGKFAEWDVDNGNASVRWLRHGQNYKKQRKEQSWMAIAGVGVHHHGRNNWETAAFSFFFSRRGFRRRQPLVNPSHTKSPDRIHIKQHYWKCCHMLIYFLSIAN